MLAGMLRAASRAPWFVGAALAAALAVEARADILPDPCEVKSFERYLGERCLKCEASEYEPERCRREYAAKGLVQRCSGSPLDTTLDSTVWGEVWCLPRSSTAELPAALPNIERVGAPDDPAPGLPRIPPGFKAGVLAPNDEEDEAQEKAGPEKVEAEPAAAPEAAPAPPAERPAAAGCTGCSAGAPAGPLAGLLALRRRRRRVS